MIKCTGMVDCPVYHDNRCCHGCAEANCTDRCGENPTVCGAAATMGDSPSTEIALFQSKALATMKAISDLNLQMKTLEAKDKDLRKQLQAFMDEYNIKKFENAFLKITYVEPTTRTSIDSTRLKKELPDIAQQYSKVSQVKGSVRIEVK